MNYRKHIRTKSQVWYFSLSWQRSDLQNSDKYANVDATGTTKEELEYMK